jgi:hypothetical protein
MNEAEEKENRREAALRNILRRKEKTEERLQN